MHIKLCLTICQARSRQPLGQDDRFQSWMRHQSLSRGDWLFVCAAVALHLGEAKVGWLLPLPLYIHCSYLTPCHTLNAQHGNAYLHFAGPRLHMRSIICMFWCWIGLGAGVSGAGLAVWLLPPLAAFVHLFQNRLDGGVLAVCFVGLPVFSSRCCDSWLTSGKDASLCLSKSLVQKEWKALLLICFEAATELEFWSFATAAERTHEV